MKKVFVVLFALAFLGGQVFADGPTITFNAEAHAGFKVGLAGDYKVDDELTIGMWDDDGHGVRGMISGTVEGEDGRWGFAAEVYGNDVDGVGFGDINGYINFFDKLLTVSAGQGVGVGAATWVATTATMMAAVLLSKCPPWTDS